tara:strand:- start:323 stop:484 length:162 start_codon:yes stop_codon:yes gene_type:complete
VEDLVGVEVVITIVIQHLEVLVLVMDNLEELYLHVVSLTLLEELEPVEVAEYV